MTRWVHKNNMFPAQAAQRDGHKERGVSKKERRRRRAAMIEAMDQVDKSPEEALQALKEAMNVDTSNET